MHVQELLEFVDESVYIKTGEHLNDLQRKLIEGILKHQKYSEIAENYPCTAGHAKDEGYKLLQLLSDIFDESVHKRNLKSVLERQNNINFSFGAGSINNNNIHNTIDCLNFDSNQPKNNPDKTQFATPKFHKRRKNKTKIETIDKLRQFGLNAQQIAEVLKLPLNVVKQIDSEE